MIHINLENHYDLISLLLNENELLFNLVLDKCENKNALLNNGETFLTNLFKERYSAEIIDSIIDKQIFDANVTNKSGESPLVLACQNVMVSTVAKIIVKYPLFPSIKERAIETAFNIQTEIIRSVLF